VDADGAETVAAEIEKAGGRALAIGADVSRQEDINHLVTGCEAAFGPVSLFFSNAGIIVAGGPEAADEAWSRIWSVNVQSHVYVARAVLPGMLARREGYLVITASAAGLLTQLGSAPYAVTKHAAVALAEWLAMTYGDAGIRVSCLCPQGVRTRMLLGDDLNSTSNFLYEGSVSPEEVAEAVVTGLREERFLILPHPEVAEYFRRKADDYDRWLRGMRRLRKKLRPDG
jgi:NAD(P)-dependent dehydrogenase (short-subunit alcohol dehydrogenase family)